MPADMRGLLLVAVAGFPACTTTRTISGLCGSPPHQAVCVNQMTVREDKVEEFQTSSRLAIDAIASEGFRSDLTAFIANHARTGGHSAAWSRVNDAGGVVAGLLQGIQGVSVATMSDMMGAWYKIKSRGGNMALEGNGEGPILVNPFYQGSRADYANTIAHEAAHRAPLFLEHPSYRFRRHDIGECEPPYVIGSLVQKQIEGPSWQWTGDDCALLEPAPQL